MIPNPLTSKKPFNGSGALPYSFLLAADTITEYYTVPVWGIQVNKDKIEVFYNKADSDKRFAEARALYPDAKIEKLTKEEINEAIKNKN